MQGGFLVSLFYLYIKLILLELYRSKKAQYISCIVLFCARNRSRSVFVRKRSNNGVSIGFYSVVLSLL